MLMPLNPMMPNFENCSATELDVTAKASPSKDGHDRLMAIRALSLGIEHDQDFRLKVPQPWPDRQDEEARNAFIQRLQTWLEDEEIEL